MEPVTCIALCGLGAYGCSKAAEPLTGRLTAMRLKRRKNKEAAQLREIVARKEHPAAELAEAALWRYAHLQLANARGAHDAAARAAALRLALCEDVPLDALRAIAEGMRAEVAARRLTLRTPSIKERALGRLKLPGLRSAAGGEECESGDRRRLARDTFFAFGGLALTSSDVGAAAAAVAAAVLDSPAASAAPGEREVVAESIQRLSNAIAEQHAKTLREVEAEAEDAARKAERARSRAASGRKPSGGKGVEKLATADVANAPTAPKPQQPEAVTPAT